MVGEGTEAAEVGGGYRSSMAAAEAAAEKAVRCLGRGFDMAGDLRLKYCKGDAGAGCLVDRSGETAPLTVPGVGVIGDVPADVRCDKGDRVRFKSDVLDFNKMSELFNQRSSVEGKIPSGQFNASFDLDSGSWAHDAPRTKCLAMDGYFISLFDLRLDRRRLALAAHVLADVPPAWDPSAIARFIEKYGTHVIVGLSMGGQDVVYVKQDKASPLSPSEIKEHLDRLGDQLFTGTCAIPPLRSKSKDKFKGVWWQIPEAFNVFDAQIAQQRLHGITTLVSSKEGVTVIYSKRGGNTTVTGGPSHSEWLLTVPAMPDVINVKLVPITSLIRGMAGTGFLSHAINLYLRYKPPVADLRYFLDFQHHCMWVPVLGELPLGPCSNRQGSSPALHFSLLGSKLYVSSSEVVVPKLPVTGMRLHLEGKKNNSGFYYSCSTTEERARDAGNVLHLRLLYAELPGHAVVQSKWARGAAAPTPLSGKSSSFLPMSFSGSTSGGAGEGGPEQGGLPVGVNINSGVFAGGPPVPVGAQKLLKFVDTSQVTMGPQDSPGYWLATGARLDVDKGRIMLHVKFSLLASAS
uniref:MACPF domain-containing protein n=1 Tax=Oryza brachyantha TaxID=4533 RepID=J3LGV3_ORYBR